ncbi:unnamed protein product [Arctia plantaginis]|uniref:Uncharacterized protein n=1 Tax=Arctia plantaginis TaxID=874455 RepID=A0A8S0ZCX2_ARCPL|nr:unnamed protein product [Arctia plantaginis]CAB3235783.1 unnamed protein product [Arctia plantaginis]
MADRPEAGRSAALGSSATCCVSAEGAGRGRWCWRWRRRGGGAGARNIASTAARGARAALSGRSRNIFILDRSNVTGRAARRPLERDAHAPSNSKF